MSTILACLVSQASAIAASEEVFTNGFEPEGYPIPLASPYGADDYYTAQGEFGGYQIFELLIDTGSATLAVAGADCTSGCSYQSPLYTPSQYANATGLTTSANYVSGSWSGSVYQDVVTLGNGSSLYYPRFADITTATNFFPLDNTYQGIIGLGPQSNASPNTDAYIPFAASNGLEDMLAFDLCDNTGTNAGTMWLGGDGFASTAQYTPLVPNDPFYRIDVDGLSLGGTIVASNASSVFQQPILDTGTSLFYVPSAVYNAFVSALTSSAGFTTVFGSNQFSQFQGYMCVNGSNVTDAQVESELPAITLSLPNMVSGQPDMTIQAPALDTYIAKAGGGEYCLTITPGGSPPSVFGVAFMQAFRIVIDLQSNRAGFAPQTTCPAPASLNPIVHLSKNGPSAPLLPRSP